MDFIPSRILALEFIIEAIVAVSARSGDIPIV